MRNSIVFTIVLMVALNLAGCVTFARIYGARTLPCNEISLGMVAGL
ncbi:MAG: hypothetical protein ACO3A4_04825 [Silvanigrellaceae bacterium]